MKKNVYTVQQLRESGKSALEKVRAKRAEEKPRVNAPETAVKVKRPESAVNAVNAERLRRNATL